MAQGDLTLQLNESDFRDFMNILGQLDKIDQAPAIKASLLAGITKIVEKGKSNLQNAVYSRNVPWQRTGNLKRSITKKVLQSKAAAYGGFRRNSKKGTGIPAGNHAHLVDRGHSGPWKAKPYPFWTPAVEAEGPKAMDALMDGIYESLDKIMNRK